MSNYHPQGSKITANNDLNGIPVGADESALFTSFLDAHDFADNSRKAMIQDMMKSTKWFSAANHEPFMVGKVTTR